MFIYTQYTHVVSYGATDVFGSEWQEFPGFGDWCASKGTVWTAMPKHVRWDLLFDFVGVKCHHLPAEKLNLTAAKTVARVHGCWCTVLWHGCFLLLDVQECFFFGRTNWCFGSRGCNTLQGFWLIDPFKFPIPNSSAGGFSVLAPWCLAMANASRNLHTWVPKLTKKTAAYCWLYKVLENLSAEGISNWWCIATRSQLIHLDKGWEPQRSVAISSRWMAYRSIPKLKCRNMI